MATVGAPSRYEGPSTGALHGIAGPGGSTTGRAQVLSPTLDPTFAAILEELRGMIGGVGGTPDIATLLSQGANSPLMQAIIQPSLNYSRGQQALQQRGLMEQFREAGTLGGGPMAVALNELFNQQQQGEGSLIGQTMSSNLSPILNAMMQEYTQRFAPIQALTAALGASRPEFMMPPQGGSRGGGGGGTFRGDINPLNATSWTPGDMTANPVGYFPDGGSRGGGGGGGGSDISGILQQLIGGGGGMGSMWEAAEPDPWSGYY